jgi:hypothetical protein
LRFPRSPRRRSRPRALALCVAAALALAGCARDDEAPDLLDRALDATREVTGVFEGTGPRARVTPPPAEGRPYPNLASVPPKPQRPVARIRDGEIAALDRDRAAAEDRRRALGEGIVGEQASDPGGEPVGSVLIDSIGAVSSSDEAVLRRAIERAGIGGDARIRLVGEAGASLAAADRLARLGFRRERIDLAPAPSVPGGRRTVEISVARTVPGR